MIFEFSTRCQSQLHVVAVPTPPVAGEIGAQSAVISTAATDLHERWLAEVYSPRAQVPNHVVDAA